MSEQELILNQLMKINKHLGMHTTRFDSLEDTVSSATEVAIDNQNSIRNIEAKLAEIDYAPLEEKKKNYEFTRATRLKAETKRDMAEQVRKVGLLKFANWGFTTILAVLGGFIVAAWHTLEKILVD